MSPPPRGPWHVEARQRRLTTPAAARGTHATGPPAARDRIVNDRTCARLSRRGIAHTIPERPTSSGTAAHGVAAGFGIGVGTTPAYTHQVIGLLASRAPA